MRRHRFLLLLLAVTVALAGVMGCDNLDTERKPNQAPAVYLSSGPANNDANVNYRVHFYWNGYDPDGRVDHFEYMVTNDEVTGSLIIDEDIYATLAALDDAYPQVDYSWRSIEVHDTTISVTADSIPVAGTEEDSLYFYGGDRFLFRAHHTFFIRAVDEDGDFSKVPAHRTFTATTIAPEVKINHPSDTQGVGGYDFLPPDIFFRWAGNDSVGDGTVIEPDSTRYALLKRGDLGLDTQFTGRLLSFPDSVWSVWRGWDQVDSLNENLGGKRALITGLTPTSAGGGAGFYLFFVQAKDEAGAISSHFEDGKNLRKIRVVSSLAPKVTVTEPVLGVRVSSSNQTYDFTVAENQTLRLRWSATAEAYGSEITGYRYGWDILDTENDEEWSSWSLATTSTQASFVSGSHSFFLEARDYSGTTTRVVYRLFVVPFTMERELLFIDDYNNTSSSSAANTYPSSPNQYNWGTYYLTDALQRAFWDAILEEYDDYDSVVDFFRVTAINPIPPFETVALYKRLIWEVKEGGAGEAGLSRVARFVDVYAVNSVPFDYLSAFMDRGGQLLLCGSNPVLAMLPTAGEMADPNYERRLPMAFLKHLAYSEGSSSESQAAVGRFLPYRYFGLDAVVKGADQDAKTYDWTGPDWRTVRTFWGLYGAGYPGAELASFPNTTSWAPADTLRFRPEIYQWFHDAGGFFNGADPRAVGCTAFPRAFGLNSVEIYNWDFFKLQYDPPLTYRTSKYIPLLSYVPADPTTRWGQTPSPDMCYRTSGGENHDELGYSTGGGGLHAVAVVGMEKPATPSVLIGFTPYYLAPAEAQGFIDHILIDIFHMTK